MSGEPPVDAEGPRAMPLDGLRVIDVATLYAGPMAAMFLADFGAEVIKIEHPDGDPVRRLGYEKDGVGLSQKVLGRNKHSMTLDLGAEAGQDVMRRLIAEADVLIESFRPGTLERWGLSPAELHAINPRLVIARVSGFGQAGPYRDRPGFGTLAEAMSGFAAINGAADGPPMLPAFPLADSVSGLATAFAVMLALHARAASGRGQVIDLALIEPLLTILGPHATWFQQLGVVQERAGNASVNAAPRNVYRTRDGRWAALSTSAPSVAARVMRLVGRPDIIDEPWFASGRGRVEHSGELDAAVGAWLAGHDLDEALSAFAEAGAALAPVYDIRDIFADPQYRALKSIVMVPDDDLGPVAMQNVLFRLSETPGRVRWAGRPKGHDTRAVLGDTLGLSNDDIERLAAQGVI